MSQHDLYTILDECLSRVRRGESPEACLADYPAYAGQLAPDLALTAELAQLPLLEPTPDAVAAGYEKMMAALEQQETMTPLARLSAFVGNLVSGFGQRPRGLVSIALRAAAVALLLIVVAGGLAVTAAADTLPGDALYPLKRSWENARLTLTTDDSSRQALRSTFEKRRREEVRAVQELRRPVAVEFSGVVESVTGDAWQVNGLDLIITDDTVVTGAADVGRKVTVQAQVRDDGSLNALAVVVESPAPLPPAVRPTPTIEPTRTSQPAGSTLATRDEVAPTPTPSPEKTRPEATTSSNSGDRPTPEPTRTTASSVDGAPSVDGEPTREPTPTDTPSTDSLATPAPRPTATPTGSDQRPTPTPTPTRRTSDVAPPTATPTSPANTVDISRTPTPTRSVAAGDWLNRSP